MRCAFYYRARLGDDASPELLSRLLRYCEAERSRGGQYGQMPELARRIVELKPDKASAHAALAAAFALATLVSSSDRSRDRAAAYEHANKALALDPDNGAARWTFGAVVDPEVKFAARERYFREAIALDPEFIWARNSLGHIMATIGRTKEALGLYEEFVANFPLDAHTRLRLAYLQAAFGRLSLARQNLDYLITNRPGWRTISVRAIRVELLYGDVDRVGAWVSTIQTTAEDRRCLDAIIAARRSGVTMSEAEIADVCGGIRIVEQEQIYALFGHVDAVFETLERRWAEHTSDPREGPSFVFEPHFEDVRADPRFMVLMARLGIVDYWLETDQWADFCKTASAPYDCRTAAQAAWLAVSAGAASEKNSAPD